MKLSINKHSILVFVCLMIVLCMVASLATPNFAFAEQNTSADSNAQVLDEVPTEGENLFADPSFENNTSVGCFSQVQPTEISPNWTKVSWVGNDIWAGNLGARTGNGNMFMTYCWDGLPASDFPTLYIDVNIETNTYYEFSFYVKKYGDIEKFAPLFYGTRDIASGVAWDHLEKKEKTEFSTEYEKVSFVFNSGNKTVIRLAIYTDAMDYTVEQRGGGYHIDDAQLKKVSTVESVTFSVGSMKIGQNAQMFASGVFANGNTHSIKHGDGVALSFESDNENVIAGDNMGNLVVRGEGQANVTLKANCYGKTVQSTPVAVVVGPESKTDEVYISKVVIGIPETILEDEYQQISFSVLLSDGTTAPLADCNLTLNLEDISVAKIRKVANGYYIIGVHKGQTKLYAAATYNGSTNFGRVDVVFQSENLLYDGGFEVQKDKPYWTIQTNCGTDVDDGVANNLSHGGFANFWFAAPVSWDANIANNSRARVYQIVDVKAGTYEVSGYINRFPATGVDGLKSACGGVVTIGAIKLEAGQETNTKFSKDFDTTYGFGGYQKISTVFTAETDGQWLIFCEINGDEEFGLGMQLDDMCLKEARYPEKIEASLSYGTKLEVDDLTKVIITATYADGSQEVLETNARIKISDYNVCYISNGYLVARNNGEATLTVILEVLGKQYVTTLDVEVGSQVVTPTPTGLSNGWIIAIVCAGVVVVGATVVIVVLIKRKGDRHE